MNVEHRTLNVQHRIMNSVYLKKTEQHAAQAPALHERISSSKFGSTESVAGCGSVFCDSLVLRSIKRSLRLVGVVAPTPRRAPSIFDVRCSTFFFFRKVFQETNRSQDPPSWLEAGPGPFTEFAPFAPHHFRRWSHPQWSRHSGRLCWQRTAHSIVPACHSPTADGPVL